MKNNKWTTSLDGELFNGEMFDTKEEAIIDMASNLDTKNLKEGFWVGQVKECHTSDFIDCDSMIENAQCQADDVADEASEDYLSDITEEKKEELNELVRKWFDDNGFKPDFYSVINVEKLKLASQKLELEGKNI